MSLMARYARPRVTKRPDIRPHLIIATRDALASREESIYGRFEPELRRPRDWPSLT